MESIAVFVNDAAYARHIVQPLLGQGDAARWVIVACPPVLTRHVGRWLNQAARDKWRERWAGEAFAALEPMLLAHGARGVEKVLARRPLVELSARLVARTPGLRLLDARRPHLGRADEPITRVQPPSGQSRWATTLAATSGLGAVLLLAD